MPVVFAACEPMPVVLAGRRWEAAPFAGRLRFCVGACVGVRADEGGQRSRGDGAGQRRRKEKVADHGTWFLHQNG